MITDALGSAPTDLEGDCLRSTFTDDSMGSVTGGRRRDRVRIGHPAPDRAAPGRASGVGLRLGRRAAARAAAARAARRRRPPTSRADADAHADHPRADADPPPTTAGARQPPPVNPTNPPAPPATPADVGSVARRAVAARRSPRRRRDPAAVVASEHGWIGPPGLTA